MIILPFSGSTTTPVQLSVEHERATVRRDAEVQMFV
jgi:hypothetical protein